MQAGARGGKAWVWMLVHICALSFTGKQSRVYSVSCRKLAGIRFRSHDLSEEIFFKMLHVVYLWPPGVCLSNIDLKCNLCKNRMWMQKSWSKQEKRKKEKSAVHLSLSSGKSLVGAKKNQVYNFYKMHKFVLLHVQMSRITIEKYCTVWLTDSDVICSGFWWRVGRSCFWLRHLPDGRCLKSACCGCVLSLKMCCTFFVGWLSYICISGVVVWRLQPWSVVKLQWHAGESCHPVRHSTQNARHCASWEGLGGGLIFQMYSPPNHCSCGYWRV